MYETQNPSRQFIIHIRALGSLIQKTDIDKVAVYYIGENNVALTSINSNYHKLQSFFSSVYYCFCDICRKQCHCEFDTIFGKSCIYFVQNRWK